MANTRNKIEQTDRRGLLSDDVCCLTPSEMRRIVEGNGADRLERHRAYHRSHHPERGPYSPCMHRPDAKTVSYSEVTVSDEQVCFRYRPLSPCADGTEASTICLPRP